MINSAKEILTIVIRNRCWRENKKEKKEDEQFYHKFIVLSNLKSCAPLSFQW